MTSTSLYPTYFGVGVQRLSLFLKRLICGISPPRDQNLHQKNQISFLVVLNALILRLLLIISKSMYEDFPFFSDLLNG
jgi:hypothetical protein